MQSGLISKVVMTEQSHYYGATVAEWNQFAITLGLNQDLLPVVSNPHAKISPKSTVGTLGKVPTLYNKQREVVGIACWTEKYSTAKAIDKWQKEPDYGICIQTRRVRALDIDIDDKDKASAIASYIENWAQTKGVSFPKRIRGDGARFLLIFIIEGTLPKRVAPCEGGVIEFLGTGQQFVAAGTHPKRQRYEWVGGLPQSIPTIALTDFDELFNGLVDNFGKGLIEISGIRRKKEKGHSKPKAKKSSADSSGGSSGEYLSEVEAEDDAAPISDPVCDQLEVLGVVRKIKKDGEAYYIECPFKAEHTSKSGITETTYFPAGSRGYKQGNFVCKHAHCAGRSNYEFLDALGIDHHGFEDLGELTEEEKAADKAKIEAEVKKLAERFHVTPLDEFAHGPEPEYIIDNILPEGDLVMIYGESGSGKTFFVLDMMASIALGNPWRGRETKRGRVVYIAAEGAGGIRKRARAYQKYYNVSFGNMFGVINAAPNLMDNKDIKSLIEAINVFGGANVIVVDTLAQTTSGANENAGEDMGKAISLCKVLHDKTSALIILIHHSGKDATRGARGWSGIKAAMDAEIEIQRRLVDRVAKITKQKDGEDGEEFFFDLFSVDIGVDKKGKPVNSCVVSHKEVSSSITKDKSEIKGRLQKKLYDIIKKELVFSEMVEIKHVIDLAVNSESYDPGSDPTNPRRDRRRDTFNRELNNLEGFGIILIENDVIKLPSSPH